MTAARATRARTSGKRSPSSDLGTRLRSVLVSPRSGYRAALRGDVPQRVARSPLTAFVVVLAGAATMALWLKISSLLGVIERPQSEATWQAALPTLVLGSVLGVAGYLAWSFLAARLSERSGAASRDRLRLVWSFSDFPLAIYCAVILPLDLLLVGPEVFSSDSQDGSFAMIWTAVSLALLVSATAWSAFLFVRGLQAATGRSKVLLLAASAFFAVSVFYIFILIKELVT